MRTIASHLGQDETGNFLQSIIFKNTYDLGSDPGQIPENRMEAINANLFGVIVLYFFLPFNKEAFFIPAFLILLPGVYLCVNFLRQRSCLKTTALAVSALYSIAAPISWLVLAKAHSATHFQYNFIVWFVPTHLMMVALITNIISKRITANHNPDGNGTCERVVSKPVRD